MNEKDLQLHYLVPNGSIIDVDHIEFDKDYNWVWLNSMVKGNDDVIFFFTVKTTDIWPDEEPEWDFNEYPGLRIYDPELERLLTKQGPIPISKVFYENDKGQFEPVRIYNEGE